MVHYDVSVFSLEKCETFLSIKKVHKTYALKKIAKRYVSP